MMKMKIKTVCTVLFLLFCFRIYAEDITFSGGFTTVSLKDGNREVILSGGAQATTDDVKLNAKTLRLYGEDYCFVECTGDVKVVEEKRSITMTCPSLFYNRSADMIISDGWIEIDDTEHEVKLSGSWLEYNMDTSVMILQMQASVQKNTDSGLMTCSADSIEFNNDEQTVILKGSAKVVWGDDNYNAAMIVVDLDTEDVALHGSVSGEVNG
ncbi:MAG: hypothetical protein MJ052_01330 [Sphaerochaetaceae bacterium]|nr:hypothetical protein [Sphaerochaetaceae bacterium]